MQPPPNQNNANFRPQQRMPVPPQGQKQMPPNDPPQKMPQQIPGLDIPLKVEGAMQSDAANETGKQKPLWLKTAANKITRKERQRRRNIRLSRMIQPKNAVMILNELVKSATYTVTDVPQPPEMNQYTATVLVDGVTHIGHGRSKMEAKSMAAENALKYIVKNRQFSALSKDVEGDDKMEMGEDGTPTLPWQHVASFALYKLLNAWGEDPNQTRGDAGPGQIPQNRPSRKMPENAAHMNPLMLLNQMMPHAQFEELGRTGNPPNVIFTFKCTVGGQSFNGTGPNKKSAKKMAAFAVCHKMLGIQYPQEVYTPSN
ncbi:double-stranded RNA-specific editase Adar isoform X2 [Tribolium castaneum]|nr:PREDICTED: double-stranded RNA-specific editase Adar isoform X2 [Tribolium castaneum]|eukprot:XP_015838023.1 PREDICTED: double-stranded RNA-specific editase Adar isoform X2 [Tribolium castaneum]